MADDRYDLVIIGSGPAGYTGAIRAGQLGLKVACVEKDVPLGGTCLNVGCIPSKTLLDSSELYLQARTHMAAHGIRAEGVSLDLPTMMARKDKVVRGLTQGIAGLFKKYKVTRIAGKARIASATKVVVQGEDGEQTLETARVMIATGSEPTPLPKLPFDGERVLGSTEALSLPSVPKRLLVVGGGAIGLELGSVWRRLGAEVTVVEFLDRIVPWADGGMGKALQRALTKQGMTFRLETSASAVERTADGVRVTLAGKTETTQIDADVVLVAIGRRPYADGLGARELGVAFDDRGRITVNGRFETSVPGVFAVGDVIAGPMLAHKGEEEAVAAVEGMAGHPVHVDYDVIPNVVYTWPELASVGITEEDARGRGVAINVGTFPFTANARARCMDETEGSAKVIADAKTDRVLGVHILGPRASDMIAEAVVAMTFGASAEDIARTVHAHPTLPEAVREAALGVAKRTLNI
ncbi:MAG TPA: dihydrolipoyl dehydrogenase [Candidatus Binatia bacterium]|jgi:dihydrolipoamide dehydrogenase|nr:dihydrolipoyl dehydrogenase [Candidatus Binatia bacterium]